MDDKKGIYINQNIFYYAIDIRTDDDLILFNNSYSDLFEVSQSFIIKEKYGTKKSKNYDSKLCESGKPNILFDNMKIVNKSNLEYLYCFDIPDEVICGDYNDDIFKYIVINININYTKYNTNPEKVAEIFFNRTFKFSLYFSDYDTDYKRFKTNKSYNSVYSYLDYYYGNKLYVFFSNNTFELDKNEFYRQVIRYSYNKYTRSETNFYNLYQRTLLENDKPNLALAKLYIRADFNNYVVSISFNKLPQLLSNITAVFINLFLGLNFLLSEWNFFKLKQAIFSRVYKYKDIYHINPNALKLSYAENFRKLNNSNNLNI